MISLLKNLIYIWFNYAKTTVTFHQHLCCFWPSPLAVVLSFSRSFSHISEKANNGSSVKWGEVVYISPHCLKILLKACREMNTRFWGAFTCVTVIEAVSWFLFLFQVFSSSQWKPHWTGETVNTERHRVPGVMFLTQATLSRGPSLEGAISYRPACSSDATGAFQDMSTGSWTELFAQRAAEQWRKEQCCQKSILYEFPLQRNVGTFFFPPNVFISFLVLLGILFPNQKYIFQALSRGTFISFRVRITLPEWYGTNAK